MTARRRSIQLVKSESLLVIAELAYAKQSASHARLPDGPILDVDPLAGPPRAVAAVAALGDDPFEPMARVTEHNLAIRAIEVFGQLNALVQLRPRLGIS